MPASCSARTMALNSCTWPPGVVALEYFEVGREESDRVVAPVVGQALVDQRGIVGEVVHRHQFDGRDTETLEVIDDHRVRHRGVGAAQLFGDVGVGLGQALDVRLVDDCVGVMAVRWAVVAPVEIGTDHDRLGHAVRRVVVVAAVGVAEVVGEQRLIPLERAVDGLGIRVDAAACSGCIAAPPAGRKERTRGSRSAGPVRCWVCRRAK